MSVVGPDRGARTLVQQFTSSQRLDRRFAFMLAGRVFTRIRGPAFSLAGSLVCIVEEELVKFGSQHKLRSIFALEEIYRAATEQETRAFAMHAHLWVADVARFSESTDQPIRKLIQRVQQEGILENYSVAEICGAANGVGVDLAMEDGRIGVPTARAEVKALLDVLTDRRFRGALSGHLYVTNSRRAV